jgi:hypothetical protein
MRPFVRPRPLALSLALLGLLAGCGGSGGGGGGSVASSTTAGGAAGHVPSGVSQAQRQLATAALGGAQSSNPGHPELEPAAFAEWSRLIARTWPHIRTRLDPMLESALRNQIGTLGSGSLVRVLGVRSLVIDTSAPFGLDGTTSGTDLTLGIAAPHGAGASWSLSFTADVGATLTTRVLGVPVQVVVAVDVTVDVKNIRISAPVVLDVSNRTRPIVRTAAPPQVDMDLDLRSGDPLFSQIVGPLDAVLDPVIRVGLLGGGYYARQQIGNLIPALNQAPWGLGGAPTQGVPGSPSLEAKAVEVGDEILRHHLPFGTLLHTVFDDPRFGHGNVVGYGGYGDSTIWTGHYLMGEALRYDVTGDPRALEGVARATTGLDICVGLTGQRGLLSRCCIPSHDPEFARRTGGLDWGTGVTDGVLYGGENDISRDQYLGVFMGLTQVFLRVPQHRATAQRNILEMVDFLEGSDWMVYQLNAPSTWARFSPGSQTPGVVFAFTQAAKTVDPAGHGWLAQRYEELSSLLWLSEWATSREVHEGYYKFNLMHAQMALVYTTSTDPKRYRDMVKGTEVARDTVAHHENAWFDAVYGMAVPAQAPAMGQRVKDILERWLLRPRRGFTQTLSQDPRIQKVLYSSPLQLQTPPTWVAVYPVPVELRPSGDFQWQQHPFRLDGHDDPREQLPGADLTLPYWTARSFGLLP